MAFKDSLQNIQMTKADIPTFVESERKELNVIFSTSKIFIQHLTVAITSLLENNKNLNIKIYIIHNMDDTCVLDMTIKFIKEKYNIDINLLKVENFDFSTYRTTTYFDTTTYYKLFITRIIPENIDTVLYLDCDIVVNESIEQIANRDISNDYIHAVSELDVITNINRLNKLGYNLTRYFNAGVLLINLKKWRQHNVFAELMIITDRYMQFCEWFDQDILNLYFSDNWKEMDKTFNGIYITRPLPEVPIIIHYNSFSKPWYYVDIHPYKYLYWKYLKLTPFRGNKPENFTFKNLIFKSGRLIKRKLRMAGIIK